MNSWRASRPWCTAGARGQKFRRAFGLSDEPGNETGVASAQPQYGSDEPQYGSDSSQAMLRLLDCQLNEVASQMGQQAGEVYMGELADAAMSEGGRGAVQEILAEEGYTCGGTADEVLGQYGQ